MAVSSAKGDVSRDATAQVIEWFWRSSQFYLHLKSVACTVPVGVTKCFKTRPKVIYIQKCRHHLFHRSLSIHHWQAAHPKGWETNKGVALNLTRRVWQGVGIDGSYSMRQMVHWEYSLHTMSTNFRRQLLVKKLKEPQTTVWTKRKDIHS